MRAVIYSLYSSEKQNDASIDAQLRACNAYCAYHVYEAIAVRSDERPAFQRMIADARNQSFDVLVFHKTDRFSRDRYDHSHYKRILQKNNIKLEYVDQRIDDTPEGNLTESLLIGISEYYSRDLARETMKGMNERAHKCNFNGGISPLDFSLSLNGDYILNDHEAAAIRLIFPIGRMAFAKQGFPEIERDFAGDGLIENSLIKNSISFLFSSSIGACFLRHFFAGQNAGLLRHTNSDRILCSAPLMFRAFSVQRSGK